MHQGQPDAGKKGPDLFWLKRRMILRVDGSVELVGHPMTIARICREIGASALDTVTLRSWGDPAWVMMVDDSGLIDGRDVNPLATALYHQQCLPGTTNPICGDVAIMPDDDFAPPDR